MSPFQLKTTYLDPSARRLSAYFSQLFIMAGTDYFHYCILDTEKNCFIALNDYQAHHSEGTDHHLPEYLDALIRDDELLKRKYPVTVLAVESPYSLLVPASLHDPGNMTDHLKLNFNLPEGLVFGADRLTEPDLWNIYGTSAVLYNVFSGHFPNAIRYHIATPLILTLLHFQKQYPGNSSFFLNFSGKRFDLAIFSDANLLFFNSFQFETGEDVLYYTLYAAEQLKIRTNDVVVRISGDIEPDSLVSGLLREFFPEVRLMVRPEGFTYSAFLNCPEHKYHSLFSLALCGL